MKLLKIKAILIAFVAGMTIMALGCYGPVNTACHEPGKYKGKNDPLLKKLRSTDYQSRLEERFRAVQTDR